jgi:Cu2+-exporting ATPase
MTPSCAHCGLPAGRLAQRRETDGVERWFCCYGCCLAFQFEHGSHDEPEAASLLIRVGAGGFLAMNIMLFSLLLYAGAFAGNDAVPTGLVHWILLGLATALVAVLAGPFLSGARQALGEGRLGADTLVCIGALAAYGYSAYGVVSGSAAVYFDTAAMVLVLFTVGRYLEAQGRVRAMRSVAPMLAGDRAQVTVVTADGEVVRPVAAVRPGDAIRVRPGERVAVDGEVLAGRSQCDESILTGQPAPCPKRPGDWVHAGSLNGTGLLLVRASVAGCDTRWVRLGRLVREALSRKSPLGEAMDRAASRFVPGVLLLALATAGFWASRADLGEALLTGLSVLVVACPCSLGLAAPLASALGIGQAAQRGILVRGSSVLERLADLRCVAFDKTGTLTAGRLRVVALDTDAVGPAAALRRVCRVASGSEHPLARAVVAYARQQGAEAAPAEEVRALPGAGVEGLIDGERCVIGSAALVGAVDPTPLAEAWATAVPHGATAVYVAWNGRVHGRFVLADELRPGAREAVAQLRSAGLRTLLLSGDGPQAVAPLAATLGMDDWSAALSPEDKVHRLRQESAVRGPVAMVGDGLNDGPVLAAAAVGIAFGDATDLARESADVIVPEGRLDLLPWVLALAQRVHRSVRANLLWAFGYNAVALALAAAGLLQPVTAATLMALSSAIVVARSLRANGADVAPGAAASGYLPRSQRIDDARLLHD